MKIVEFIKSILSDRKKLSIAVIAIIVAALPLTVWVALQQQEIRQRAANEPVAFFFSDKNDCSTKLTALPQSSTNTVNLCLNTENTGTNLVSGFDITIAKSSGVTLSNFTDGIDGAKVPSLAITPAPNGNLRIVKVESGGAFNWQGTKLNIGSFTVTTTATNGSINMTSATVTSPTTDAAVPADQPSLNITAVGQVYCSFESITYQDGNSDGQWTGNDTDPPFTAAPAQIKLSAPGFNETKTINSGSNNQASWTNIPAPASGSVIYTMSITPPSGWQSSGPGSFQDTCTSSGALFIHRFGLKQNTSTVITPTPTRTPTPTPTTTTGTKPAKPALNSNPTCSGTTSQVTLSWNAISGADGYKLYEFDPSISSSTWTLKQTITPGSTTSYVYSNLKQGSGYTLRITAFNSAGESTPSDYVGFTALKCTGPTSTPTPTTKLSPTPTPTIPAGSCSDKSQCKDPTKPVCFSGTCVKPTGVYFTGRIFWDDGDNLSNMDNYGNYKQDCSGTCDNGPGDEKGLTLGSDPVVQINQGINVNTNLKASDQYGNFYFDNLVANNYYNIAYSDFKGTSFFHYLIEFYERFTPVSYLPDGVHPHRVFSKVRSAGDYPHVVQGIVKLPLPNCTSGMDCSGSVCQPKTNSCDNKGTQSCTLTKLNNGSTVCEKVVIPNQDCSTAPSNCSTGYTCNSSKQCAPNPTSTPKPTVTPTKAPTPTPTRVATPTPTRTPTPTPIPGVTPTTCNDGTPVNTCKTGTPPVFCPANGGSPINDCSRCGCPSGQGCTQQGFCVAPTIEPTRTPTPTRIPPTPTQFPPTSTPVPGATNIALNIGLDSIGSVGDSTRPGDDSASTKNPVHTSRAVTVEVYNGSETLVSTHDGTINYNANSGIFTGTISLGQTPSGNYIVKVKIRGYLRKRIPGITALVAGSTHNATQINMAVGDLNNDNTINIQDYNILQDCIFSPSNSQNTGACTQNPDYAGLSDLNDDGVKNILDYSLFVRELVVKSGD